MKILAVDTSAKVSSAAVVDETGILGECSIHTRLTHSQTMMPMILSLLSCAQIPLEDIDGFACAAGPGSFTGLRIGISAIKGLAYGQSKRCVGISTLTGLAQNLSGQEGILCAVMDARCEQVYNALFESFDGKLVRRCEDRAIPIQDLAEEIKISGKRWILVGDGADLCYNKMHKMEQVSLANPLVKFQHAASIGTLAMKAFAEGESVSPAELMPDYLRLPQAQRHQ